jgi:alkanesulfonate monooxygenase SsuD/methylene tetrahydromethanopterin reductase-like flavin-dependent oxidoreductase (luciferase family)
LVSALAGSPKSSTRSTSRLTRGRRFTEWVELLRRCWTGTPGAFSGQHYQLPAGILAMPPPRHEIPPPVGGHSRVARSRAATIGNGWLAHQSALALDADALHHAIVHLRQAAEGAGKDPHVLWVALRTVDSANRMDALAAMMPRLVEAGVDEVNVDTDWTVADSAAAAHDRAGRYAATRGRGRMHKKLRRGSAGSPRPLGRSGQEEDHRPSVGHRGLQ